VHRSDVDPALDAATDEIYPGIETGLAEARSIIENYSEAERKLAEARSIIESYSEAERKLTQARSIIERYTTEQNLPLSTSAIRSSECQRWNDILAVSAALDAANADPRNAQSKRLEARRIIEKYTALKPSTRPEVVNHFRDTERDLADDGIRHLPKSPKPVRLPQDLSGNFETKILPRYKQRFTDIDNKIISLYALDMTTQEIQTHLKEMDGTEVGASVISEVTEAVMTDVRAWQTRSLSPIYMIVFLDVLMVKIMKESRLENRAVFAAIGVTHEGSRETLGLWTKPTEGTEPWLQILSELHNRGVKDILIACGEALEGVSDAFQTVYPKTETHLSIAHLLRSSLAHVYHKEHKQVAEDLRSIYLAATAEQAEQRLTELEARWNTQHVGICSMWRSHWTGIYRLFAYPEEIRRSIYATNVVESLHKTLRTGVNRRVFFPSEESALKFMHLALRDVPERWRRAPSWRMSLSRFEMRWGERIQVA